MFHRHRWSETSRHYNPPRVSGPTNITGRYLTMAVLYGITVVELRCDVCGDVKSVRYVGDSGANPNAALDRLADVYTPKQETP